MKLYEQGAYLINGTEVIIDSAEAGAQVAHAMSLTLSSALHSFFLYSIIWQ